MINISGERRLTSIKQLIADMIFNANLTGTITIDEITNTVTVQLVEPVTIDGTLAISSIGGTVDVSGTLTIDEITNPIDVNILTIPDITITEITNPVDTNTTIINDPLNTFITNDPLETSEVVIPRTVTQTTILVSNVSVVALAANANRKWVVFKNWSSATAAPIFIHFGASAATTTNGAPITADETWQPPPGNIDTQEIRVISSTASNKELYIEEWS